MRLFRETSPAELPVSIFEARSHLRVDHSEDDALIAGYIAAATDALDGRDGLLGRALVTQRWRLVLDAFPAGPIVLPLPPLRSVLSLSYNPLSGGSAVTLSPSTYTVDGIATPTRPRSRRPLGCAGHPRPPSRALCRFLSRPAMARQPTFRRRSALRSSCTLAHCTKAESRSCFAVRGEGRFDLAARLQRPARTLPTVLLRLRLWPEFPDWTGSPRASRASRARRGQSCRRSFSAAPTTLSRCRRRSHRLTAAT